MSSGTPPLEEGLGDSDVGVHTNSPVPLIGDRPPHDFLEHWTHLTAFLRLLADESGPIIAMKSVAIELADSIGNVEGFLNGGEEYEALKNKLENIFEMLAQHYGGEASPGVSVIVERLCEDIDRELQHVKEMLNQDRLVRLKEESDDLEDVLRHYDRIIDMLKRVTLNANATMWKIMDKSGMDHQLGCLNPAMSACYNSAEATALRRGPCFEGTRAAVLAQMLTWVDTSRPGSTYWMSGTAGTGKTTIAYSLCEELSSRGWLLASFFCSKALPESRDINRIIPSIAHQIARSSDPFRCVLSHLLDKDPDAHTRLLHHQFDALIAQPLLGIKDTLPGNLVVVIDAPEECQDNEAARRLLDAVLKKSANLPVKFIVFSRPEAGVWDNVAKGSDEDNLQVTLNKLDGQVVRADIKTYLQSALTLIKPSDEQITKLSEQAGAIFIYAVIAVQYIGCDDFQRNPSVRLANVLGHSSRIKDKHLEIDDLFTTIITTAVDDLRSDETSVEAMRQVLHTVACAQEPLTVGVLSMLLGTCNINQVHATLQSLWPMLHIFGENEVVVASHPSFSDYMFDPDRSGQHHCDPQVHHYTLASRCFDLFRTMRPQFNICGLESSFVLDSQIAGLEGRVTQAITTEVFYAARYWTAHYHSATGSSGLFNELEEFLLVRLLLWMEVMTLKRCTDFIPEALRLAKKWDMDYSENLKALIHDAWRFATIFASSPVSQSTPHIYTSMLAFWPESSPIARSYARRTQGIIKPSGTAINQQQHALLVTWPFESQIFFSTISPDGSKLAVCGNDVRLVSMSTGKNILTPFKGHSGSIQFSYDGSRIVSGLSDKTIRIWSTQSGDTVLGPLEGHTRPVRSVTFSPDGSRIVSGSDDNTICIWSSHTGERLLGPLMGGGHGRLSRIKMIKYSPNGCYFVSSNWSTEITVWDSNNGQVLKRLGAINEDERFESVDISPDGMRIAAGSNSHIYVWDFETGRVTSDWSPVTHKLNGCDSMSFSPDGSWLVSSFHNRTICVWDTQSGNLVLGPLEGHTSLITSVNFSPDGAYIVSGSHDRTIRLWDTRTIQPASSPVPGHTGAIRSIGVSPDGTRVVSASEAKEVCVWDTESGELVTAISERWFARMRWPSTPSRWPQGVLSVAFTPDGTRVIVNAGQGPSVFDAATGAPCGLYANHAPSPDLIWAEYSADGSRIVTGSINGTIQVNDANTGRLIIAINLPMEAGSPRLICVSLSSDGRRIFSRLDDAKVQTHPLGFTSSSGSIDGIIQMHCADSGRLLVDPNATEWKGAIGFSPDGTRVAIRRCSRYFLIDWATGHELALQTDENMEKTRLIRDSITFTADSSRVAFAMSDYTIRIWNTQNGELIFGPITGYHDPSSPPSFDPLLSLSLFPDGGRIVTGSDSSNSMVRITDVRSEITRSSDSSPSVRDWVVNEDGWVVDDQSRLLVWVPPQLREALMWPRVKRLISRKGWLHLDFTDTCMGESWAECYQPEQI